MRHYHVWKFDKRGRVLMRVERREHIRWADTVPAVFRSRAAANKWARTHADAVPHGFKVLACDRARCKTSWDYTELG